MSEKERIYILGTGFDSYTEETAAEAVLRHIKNRPHTPLCIFTPNPLIVMNAADRPDFRAILNYADLSLADGSGIAAAALRAGTPLPCRCTGIGTAGKIIAGLARAGGSLYILGGREGTAAAAVEKLASEYPGLRISGTHSGYYTPDKEEELVREINALQPDFLCVCLGSPKQEEFIFRNLGRLKCGAAMGLGGAADVWAGKIRRAPSLFITLRLEWLWRMLREPRRFRQLPRLIKFRLLTSKRRLKTGK